MRRRYTVYRMDYVTGRKEPIGCMEERRRSERRAQRNYFALLVEARTLFGTGPEDMFRIVIDPPDGEETREGRMLAETGMAEELEFQR